MASQEQALLKQLRSTLGKMEAALDAVEQGLAWMTSDGVIEWSNEAFDSLVGRPRVEILGASLPDVLPLSQGGKRLTPREYPFTRLGKSGSRIQGEFEYFKGGEQLDIWLSIIPVDSLEDKTWVLAVRDIREQKRHEHELARARDLALESARLKSEFLANMSHEIRTPMNGVIGMTNLILDTALNREQRDFAETIRQCGESLLTIIDDILDFSKIEAGLLKFEKIDFDLRFSIEALIDLLAERAHQKGIELILEIEPGVPCLLQGDPGRLRQVLTNLIGNAIKFTDVGEVAVAVRFKDQSDHRVQLVFEVADTGIGLSEAAQRKLFRPFIQADGSTTRKYGGTGLGLAISKKLVEMMGGEIGVQSEMGRGSTFWFTARFDLRKETADQGPVKGSLPEIRVLIVDDNETNRRVLHHQFTHWGIRTRSVSGGAEALRVLRDELAVGDPFDLVLLDMQMPEMDGLMLAHQIKEQPAFSHLPLVLMTSSGQPFDGEELKKNGISAFLTKPVKSFLVFDCLAMVMLNPERYLGNAASWPSAILSELNSKRIQGTRQAGKKVLLAEDSKVNQRVAMKQVEKLGFSVEAVETGAQAVQAVQNEAYDLVLMDCQMPEMDGYEATRQIRHLEGSGRHTVIVAMTAHAMEGDREKCLAAGMDDYISKPVREEELGRVISRWVLSGKQAAGSGEGAV